MRRLSDTVKQRIVEHLACYQTHAMVAELIADEFGITVTPRHVRAYDPTSFQFAGSPRWVDYHQTIRKRFTQEIGQIAIAQRTYRLTQIQAIFDDASDRGNCRQAMKALEQAAKEMGPWSER
jgi:hypothetical protein